MNHTTPYLPKHAARFPYAKAAPLAAQCLRSVILQAPPAAAVVAGDCLAELMASEWGPLLGDALDNLTEDAA